MMTVSKGSGKKASVSVKALAFFAGVIFTPPAAGSERPLWDPHLVGGARFSYFRLRNNVEQIFENGRFVGGFTRGISIDRLVEHQNAFPLPFLRFLPMQHLGLELGWEHMVLITRTYWDYHSDGDLILSGPSFSLLWRFPFDSRFVPYVGLGRVRWDASFDHWDAFYEAGRTIEVEDTTARTFLAGCEFRLGKNLGLEVSVRHMRAAVDSMFYIDDPPRDGRDLHNIRTWTFPLDNWTWLLAGTWTF